MKQFFLYISFVCFFQATLLAQEHSNVAFIENKNQWDEKIKFKTEFRGGAIFFEKNCITYVLQDRESVERILHRKLSGELFTGEEDLLLTYHAYKVHFNNTQQNIEYEGSGVYPDYNNYYIGKNPARWASTVRKYHSITYENMYEGIHLNYYEKNHSLKYEFIIEAGSNPAAISMTYEGMDKLFLKKGNLYIRCGKQEVVELSPIAYQKDKSGDYKEIPCEYVIKKNTVTFKIGSYDISEALIIDPTLTFCSYSGSY
ncbi:MAG: hypothetical protein PHC83_09755, partial [Bacteroidales bacterium]|nr:hypothetical protein [Bacteroidales bacterium]